MHKARSLLAIIFIVLTNASLAVAQEPRASCGTIEPITMDLSASEWIAKPLSENSVASVEFDKSVPDGVSSASDLKLSGKAAGDVAGELTQFIDAVPFRGRVIALRAKISTVASNTAPPAYVTLLIGAYGKSGTLYPWMRTSVVTSTRWTSVQEPFAVPADASRLEVKLKQTAPGVSRIADASLVAIDAMSAGWEPPNQLSASNLANLHAFARLFGFVRFFHPSDQAAAANWDDVAIAGVQRVENAPDANALAQALREVFLPLAPTLRIYLTGGVVPTIPTALLPSSGAEIIGWVHHGVLLGAQSIPSTFSDERVTMKSPKPEDTFSADLGGGVSVLMPTTLYRAGSATLPQTSPLPMQPNKPELFRPSGMDRTTRLADVILSWNVFQNFYPDFEEVHVDWAGVLDATLKKAATDRDETEFLDTLYEEVAALRDGHADVFNLRQNLLLLPLSWDWVENRLVILNAGPGVKKLRAGDVVDRINGLTTAEVLDKWQPKISAATLESARIKSITRMLFATSTAAVNFEAHTPDGREIVEQVTPSDAPFDWTQFASLKPISQPEPGIWYVDLRRIRAAELGASLGSLSTAKAIIVDMRGYPTEDAQQFMAHLSYKPIATGQFDEPIVTFPDQMDVEYENVSWNLPPTTPIFTGKLIFLTNAWAISKAEMFMGMVADNHLGLIVGSTTAGTDGTENSFTVPGDYLLSWTGLRVRNLDGSHFEGVGIVPNIAASPSIAGIASGKDEVLEKALVVAKEQTSTSARK